MITGMEDLYCSFNTVFLLTFVKLDYSLIILTKTNVKITVPADNLHEEFQVYI